MKNTSGLTTITVRNEVVKLKFGLPACREFSEMCLAEDSEKYIIGTKLQALGLAKLILAGYENACIIDDITPTLTLGVFMEFIEDTILDNPKEAERIAKVFTDSRYTQKMLEAVTEAEKENDEAKKKLTGNSLSHMPITNSGSPKKNISHAPGASLSSAKRGTNVTRPKKLKQKKRSSK